MEQLVGRGDLVLLAFTVLRQELNGDPDQENRPADTQERQGEELHHHQGENDPQQDRDARAEDKTQAPLLQRQPSAGERDYDRVVTRQYDVDPDDFEDREK